MDISDPKHGLGADDGDLINRLAGLAPDAPLAHLREAKPEVVRHAQGSYRALLEPDDPAGVSRREREMIGLRVAALTPDPRSPRGIARACGIWARTTRRLPPSSWPPTATRSRRGSGRSSRTRTA